MKYGHTRTKIFAHGRWKRRYGRGKAACSLHAIFQWRDSRNPVFLELYPVVQATEEALFFALTERLYEHCVAFSDCIGTACDGAFIMVGECDSVWSTMREESPNCGIKRVCSAPWPCVYRKLLKFCLLIWATYWMKFPAGFHTAHCSVWIT